MFVRHSNKYCEINRKVSSLYVFSHRDQTIPAYHSRAAMSAQYSDVRV